MITWKKGEIGYGTRDCLLAGLAAEVIELVKKPANATLTKDGKVVFK